MVPGSRVWVTAATEDGDDFFAMGIDAETGRIRFNENGASMNCTRHSRTTGTLFQAMEQPLPSRLALRVFLQPGISTSESNKRNSFKIGFGTNCSSVSSSGGINQILVINPSNGNVFFRLINP